MSNGMSRRYVCSWRKRKRISPEERNAGYFHLLRWQWRSVYLTNQEKKESTERSDLEVETEVSALEALIGAATEEEIEKQSEICSAKINEIADSIPPVCLCPPSFLFK